MFGYWLQGWYDDVDLLLIPLGVDFGAIGSAWIAFFLNIYASSPFLGRNLSSGKPKFTLFFWNYLTVMNEYLPLFN